MIYVHVAKRLLAGIIYGLNDVCDWVNQLSNKEEIMDCLWLNF